VGCPVCGLVGCRCRLSLSLWGLSVIGSPPRRTGVGFRQRRTGVGVGLSVSATATGCRCGLWGWSVVVCGFPPAAGQGVGSAILCAFGVGTGVRLTECVLETEQ